MGTTDADRRAMRVWSLGSYSAIAPMLLPMAGHLVDSLDVSADDKILDIACGTGNVAITAARRSATVIGIDLVPAMLDEARENAAIADVEIDWRQGSATALPFPDDSFDAVLSNVGHVFAEPPEASASEMLRVTRSGGSIGFTSWTPSSVVSALGTAMKPFLPSDSGPAESPFLWGDETVVEERLGESVSSLTFETGTVETPVFSPSQYWDQAKTESGMFITALELIDDDDLPAVRSAMLDVISEHFDERRNVVTAQYRLCKAVVT